MNKNPIKRDDILEIYTDGASRRNPGPAAWSFIFTKEGEIFHQNHGYLGTTTNNTAEYKAIINALKEAQKCTRWEVKVYSDSELAVRQINKEYQTRKEHLSKLCNEVYSLCQQFDNVEFFHADRKNKYIIKCDRLCNECLDKKGFKKKKVRKYGAKYEI